MADTRRAASRMAWAPMLWRGVGTAAAWLGYVLLVLPSVVIIPISFGGGQELTFPPTTFSLSLFHQFWNDPSWWGTALTSLVVASATTVLSLLVGVPAAYALARGHLRTGRLIEAFALAPMLVPVIVLGLGVYVHFSSLGMVDTLIGLVMAHTVLVLPFMMVAVGSGLRHVDVATETVARVMGAGSLRIFFQVVFPQIRTSVLIGALFAFLISFDEVIIAYFITGPGSTTLPVKMYSAIRWEVSPVLAAVSTMLTVLSLVFCLAVMALQSQQKERA